LTPLAWIYYEAITLGQSVHQNILTDTFPGQTVILILCRNSAKLCQKRLKNRKASLPIQMNWLFLNDGFCLYKTHRFKRILQK
jgi:hypothetical protein